MNTRPTSAARGSDGRRRACFIYLLDGKIGRIAIRPQYYRFLPLSRPTFRWCCGGGSQVAPGAPARAMGSPPWCSGLLECAEVLPREWFGLGWQGGVGPVVLM